MLQQKGIYTYLVSTKNFLFHFPFDEIHRRLLFFYSRAFCFRVNRLFHSYMKPSNTKTSGKTTDMIAGICTFPRLPCPSTKRHVMLNLTSAAAAAAAAAATALRTAGWSCSVFFFFLPTLLRKLHGDGCCCTEPSEKFRVRPRYDYEIKRVSRDSKMCCCCCCRFCCGAPTAD